MKKIILSVLFLGMFSACNNGSLFEGNFSETNTAPDGKLFAQVHVETVQDLSQSFQGGKDRTNNIEDVYAITLTEASLVLGNLSFETTLPEETLTVVLFHQGEDHSDSQGTSNEIDDHTEATSCDFETTFSSTKNIDLKNEVSFPCVTINEGIYQGLKFSMNLIALKGTAIKDGTTYSFELETTVPQEILVASNSELNLTSENHHLTLKVDIHSWFHGIDFSQLETVDGVVVFSPEHNTHRFEHLVFDHLPESIQII